MFNGKPTASGLELLNMLNEYLIPDDQRKTRKQAKKPIKHRVKELKTGKEADWEKFYSFFPSSSLVIDENGRELDGTRNMRYPGKKAEPKFYEALLEAEAEGKTVDDMIAAVLYDVEMRTKQSLIKGENQLKFMHSLGKYLDERDYKVIWDMMNKKRDFVKKQPVDTTNMF